MTLISRGLILFCDYWLTIRWGMTRWHSPREPQKKFLWSSQVLDVILGQPSRRAVWTDYMFLFTSRNKMKKRKKNESSWIFMRRGAPSRNICLSILFFFSSQFVSAESKIYLTYRKMMKGRTKRIPMSFYHGKRDDILAFASLDYFVYGAPCIV